MSKILEEQKVATRYTKALFDSAVSAGSVDKVNKDLEGLSNLVIAESNLTAFFANPAVSFQEKSEFLQQHLTKGQNALTKNLLGMLLENSRIGILPMIKAQFEKLKLADNNVASAEVVTATQLDTKLEGKVRDKLQTMFGYKDVSIENKVDPGILGGIIIKLDDKVIDGSYVGRLEKIRQEIS